MGRSFSEHIRFNTDPQSFIRLTKAICNVGENLRSQRRIQMAVQPLQTKYLVPNVLTQSLIY